MLACPVALMQRRFRGQGGGGREGGVPALSCHSGRCAHVLWCHELEAVTSNMQQQAAWCHYLMPQTLPRISSLPSSSTPSSSPSCKDGCSTFRARERARAPIALMPRAMPRSLAQPCKQGWHEHGPEVAEPACCSRTGHADTAAVQLHAVHSAPHSVHCCSCCSSPCQAGGTMHPAGHRPAM